MRKKKKQLIGILLTLVMVLGQMPGMSLTAQAAGEKAYAAYDVTTETNKTKSGNDLTALQVTFNESKWYIIEDESSSATSGTVTLLSADTSFGTQKFDSESNKYSTSQVKAYLDSMTETNGAFAGVTEAIETVNLTTNKYASTEVYETVNGVKLYLLSTEEANSLPENVRKAEFTGGDCEDNEWWLRSPGYNGRDAAFVDVDDSLAAAYGGDVNHAFGVRPALKLNLSSVIFSSESNTFTVGSADTRTFVDFTMEMCNMASEYDFSTLPEGVTASGTFDTDQHGYRNFTITVPVDGSVRFTIGDCRYGNKDIPVKNKEDETIATLNYPAAGCYGPSTPGNVFQYIYTGGADTLTFASIQYCNYFKAEAVDYVSVTGVTLDKTEEQTIKADDKVSFTATVSPEDATDRTVKWSVAGTNADAVKLYTDEACTIGVGEEATETLTVYAKGISEGSATVTVTTNDGAKTSSCAVTVNEAAGEKAYTDYDVTTDTNKTKSGDALTELQVTFNERQWYIIEDNSSSATSGTITLLSADTSFGTQIFDNENNSNKYSTSQVKAYLDSMTETNGAFAGVAEAIETVNLTTNKYASTEEYETVNGVKLYLLSTEEAYSLPVNVREAGFTGGDCGYNEWWLRSPGTDGYNAAFVYGGDGIVDGNGDSVGYALGVRPALKLNLESVIFSSESNTFTVGSAAKETQTINASDVTATFGDTGKKIEASTTGDGTLSYAVKSGDAVTVDENGALTIVKIGTATVTITASETDTYAQATKEVTVTINKANAVAATVTANNRTYDGTEKPLVNVDKSTLVGGTMQYALGTATGATQSYTTSIPTATDAGTYYVWYRVTGDADHNDSAAVCVKVVISEEGSGKDDPTPSPTPIPVPVANVSGNDTVSIKKLELNVKSIQTLSVGEETTIKVAVTGRGSDASLNSVNWVAPSGHVVVTEVQADGSLKVKAVGPGTAFVTAVCGGKAKTVKYTVKQPVNKAEASLNAITLSVKEKYRICVNLDVPTTDKFFYATNDKKVCAVNGKGIIAAKGVGTTTVDILAGEKKNTAKKVASVTVTVKNGAAAAVEVKDVSINYVGNKTLYTGEMAYISTLVNGGSNNGGQAVKYSFSNKGIVKIDAYGRLTAKKAGKVIVTATCGGKTDTVELTVKQPLKVFKVNKTYVKVKQGKAKTVTLSVKTTPALNKSDIKAVWSVANEGNGVKKISDENGKAVFEVSAAAKDTVVTATVTDPATGKTYTVNSVIDVN